MVHPLSAAARRHGGEIDVRREVLLPGVRQQVVGQAMPAEGPQRAAGPDGWNSSRAASP
jgi:hypothetical protein